MISFSNQCITIASPADIKAVNDLLNSAYRGESSKLGWTTEAGLIAGETRSDEQTVREIMQQQGSVFLKYSTADLGISGCVNLQQFGDKLYLGMFSVSPHLQGAGIGKAILKAAEEYAVQVHCTMIYMTVISVRTELINWYERNGYRDTGERKPFIEDALTGRHLQPLEFMVMQKIL